jgi:hypothetical protein
MLRTMGLSLGTVAVGGATVTFLSRGRPLSTRALQARPRPLLSHDKANNVLAVDERLLWQFGSEVDREVVYVRGPTAFHAEAVVMNALDRVKCTRRMGRRVEVLHVDAAEAITLETMRERFERLLDERDLAKLRDTSAYIVGSPESQLQQVINHIGRLADDQRQAVKHVLVLTGMTNDDKKELNSTVARCMTDLIGMVQIVVVGNVWLPISNNCCKFYAHPFNAVDAHAYVRKRTGLSLRPEDMPYVGELMEDLLYTCSHMGEYAGQHRLEPEIEARFLRVVHSNRVDSRVLELTDKCDDADTQAALKFWTKRENTERMDYSELADCDVALRRGLDRLVNLELLYKDNNSVLRATALSREVMQCLCCVPKNE